MAVISFWGNSEKETGQTTSTIATSTLMAIDHNYKILTISTGFKDTTMAESFWEQNRQNNIQKMLGMSNGAGVETGMEGLSRVVTSNRIRSGIISDYAKVVFKDRLDILLSPKTIDTIEYIEIVKTYPKVIETAKNDYNLVFVDVDKRMPQEIQKEILVQSDVIVVNISQSIKSLDRFIELKRQNELFRGNNVMLLIGKYDKFSKYNIKNISRYLKEKGEISAISYNTLFFEATTEGKVPDYFLKYRNITDKTDRNAIFLDEAKKSCDNILLKIHEIGA